MIRRLALLGATTIFAAAGCGSDDKPSRDEFISKGKAICAAAEEERDAIEGAAGHTAGEESEDPALLKRLNDASRDAIAKLKALETPEEEREGLQNLIAAAEQEAAVTDDLIAALKAKDREAQQRALNRQGTASDDVGLAAGATDLAGCESLSTSD